jgi:RNA polymerase sigma-70 factor, ECF subfamily
VDDAALEALVRTFQPQLYRYIRYLGADDAVAEDVVQETFLAALQSANPPPVEARERCGAWLRGIARRLFFLHCRRVRRSPVTANAAALEQAEEVWVAETGGDDDSYRAALRKCVDELGERGRDLLERRYLREEARADIAASLDMGEEAVKSALRRLRTGLQDCVRRRLGSAGEKL